MESDEITPERRVALLGAALHAVAWELVEYETDTADRGVSEEHYRDALERARALLPTLMPSRAEGDTEEPDWEYGISYAPGNAEFEGQDLPTIQRRVKYIRRQGGYYSTTVRAVRRRPAGGPVPVEQEGERDADHE